MTGVKRERARVVLFCSDRSFDEIDDVTTEHHIFTVNGEFATSGNT